MCSSDLHGWALAASQRHQSHAADLADLQRQPRVHHVLHLGQRQAAGSDGQRKNRRVCRIHLRIHRRRGQIRRQQRAGRVDGCLHLLLGRIHSIQKKQVNINAFYQEKNLIEYLTLDQSFIITVDTDNLHLEREAIKNWPLPGMFTCYKEPKSCLMATTGRLVEYYKLYEDGHYSVNVNDSFYRYRQDESVDWLNRINATEQRHPYQPYYDSKGVFLHIYSETKV